MKKKALFLILFFAAVSSGRELLILSFDTSKNAAQKRLNTIRQELSALHQDRNFTLKRFGDRYAVVVPVTFLAQKEKIILALGHDYPHIFSIELSDQKTEPKPMPKQQSQKSQWNLWEWTAMILLSIVLVVIFAKGVRDMMRVRRSQRLMRHEQLEIEKELKKEM